MKMTVAPHHLLPHRSESPRIFPDRETLGQGGLMLGISHYSDDPLPRFGLPIARITGLPQHLETQEKELCRVCQPWAMNPDRRNFCFSISINDLDIKGH